MKKIVLFTFIVFVLLCVIPAMASDTGSISVISNPPGAQIWIDGYLQRELTPHTFYGLPVATYSVRVHYDGFVDSKNSVVVESGQTTPVEIKLTAAPNRLLFYNAGQVAILSRATFFYALYFYPIVGGVDKDFLWTLAVSWDPQFLKMIGSNANCASETIDVVHSNYLCEDAGSQLWLPSPRQWLRAPVTLSLELLDSAPVHKLSSVKIVSTFLNLRDGSTTVITDSPMVYVPEFASPYIPATVIIGFLGAVLIIRRTREN